MTAQIGDEIVIISPELHQPVRQGEIGRSGTILVVSSTSCSGRTPVRKACCRTDRTW